MAAFGATSPKSVPHLTPLRAGVVGDSAGMYQSSPIYGTHYGTTSQAKVVTSQAEPMKEQTFSEKAAPYICEFMGTFMLTFTFATCQLELLPATAIGAALVVITYAVGFVSGGHLNPAVSLAFMFSRKMPVAQCVYYMVLQLTAGLVAGFFFELVFLETVFGVMPVAPFSFSEAAWFELLFTCMLCFVFLNVAGSARNNPEHDKNQFFPLAIGFVVIAAGYAGTHISGAALNPAIAFGLDLASRRPAARWGLYYLLIEFAGAALAALLFRICRCEDYQQQLVQSGLHVDELALYVPSLSVRMFSEFVGTFFIATTFGLNVIMMSMNVGFAVGAALLSMVYALGNLSGAHFNPAVTAAVCLSGRDKCSRYEVLYYWMAQLLGGVLAGTFMQYIHSSGPTASVAFNLGGLSSGYHWGTIMVVEVFFTFLLAYTVLTVATCDQYVVTSMRSRQNFYFALAIGFAMCAGVFAAGPVSGGYINPAAALAFATEAVPDYNAAAVVKGWPFWTRPLLQAISLLCQYVAYFGHWMLYFLFELIGAVLAAAMFRLTHPAEYLQKAPTLVSYVQHVARTD